MPKVSVIIPIYNVEIYLKECLDSICNQTLKDIEIICINDGSPDNSQKILDEYASKDNRFILLSQENQGQGVARNIGISNTNGEFIIFVDPDDWIELDALEKLYNFAIDKNAEVVQFNYKEFNEYSKDFKEINFQKTLEKIYKKELNNFKFYNWKDFQNGCLRNLDLHICNRIYRTDFIKRNNCQFAPTKRAEDHLFVQSSILLAKKTYYIPEYFYNYRCRGGSIVNSKAHDNLRIFENIDLLEQFILQNGFEEELKEEFEIYKQNLLTWHYEQTLDEDIEAYKTKCKKYLSPESYNAFLKNIKHNRSFIENIFSIKNKRVDGRKHKIITILGLSFQIK